MIPNIKKLGITYFGDKYKEDYQLQNLVLLQHLEKLKLVMKADSSVRPEINPAFPATLRKLTLSGWRRPWEDLGAVGALPHLQVLKLRDHACQGHTWKTAEEQFPSLEYLLIDTSDIKAWETKMSHFKALKSLVIYGCSLLSKIPDKIGRISTLKLIEVDYANDSLVDCIKRIHREQKEEYENQTLQLELVRYKGS